MRSDHCWSHGRGRPRASFHAGSWIDRALARFDSVTPSASSTMRCTLFSGWASARPERVDLHAVAETQRPLVGDAVALAADAVPQLDERAHLARLFDEADAGVHEERDRREHGREPILGNLARLRARRRARRPRWRGRTRAPGPASPPPPGGGSCTRSPGSRAGRCSAQKAIMSTISRRLGSGGKMYVPRDRYSFTMSFCVVPAKLRRRRPRCSRRGRRTGRGARPPWR